MITQEEYNKLKPFFKGKSKLQIWNIIKNKCKEKAIKENKTIYIYDIIREVLKC